VRYRAVFFDAGETLVHPAPSFPELFAQVLEREGHRVLPDDVLAASRAVTARFSEASRDGSLWTTSPERSRAFWSSVYVAMLGELGLPSQDGLRDSLYGAFTDRANYTLFDDHRSNLGHTSVGTPGVLAGLDHLHRQRGHVGLLGAAGPGGDAALVLQPQLGHEALQQPRVRPAPVARAQRRGQPQPAHAPRAALVAHHHPPSPAAPHAAVLAAAVGHGAGAGDEQDPRLAAQRAVQGDGPVGHHAHALGHALGGERVLHLAALALVAHARQPGHQRRRLRLEPGLAQRVADELGQHVGGGGGVARVHQPGGVFLSPRRTLWT